jgi:hypothetical protein
MRTFLLLIAVTMANISATIVFAADGWTPKASELSAIISNMEDGIKNVQTQYRDARCPAQPTQQLRTACVTAYETVIARARAEQKELELELASLPLPADMREAILKLVSPDNHNKRNKETMAMSNEIDNLFPIRPKSQ